MMYLDTERLFKEKKNLRIPKHIAIVCDGNGRWAKSKGMPRSFGHKAGTKPVEDITRACAKLGVKVLTIYVFSTENWRRTEQEVDFLMQLFKEFFVKLRKEVGNEIKVKHIGSTENLSKELLQEIEITEETTKNNSGMILNIALNYGGRCEITSAAKGIANDIINGKINTDRIDESVVDNYMFTAGQPDVDLIIRTSGEKRISNFTLWQAAKAQIWVTDEYWPDFKCEHLKEAISFYNKSTN